jgi:hypothetical protein
VVLNGHDHIYERFTPLTPAGNPSRDGIREFVVGTGGNSLDAFAATERGSEVRRLTYGLLWLKLQSASYKWKFMDTHGRTHDDGVTRCHR